MTSLAVIFILLLCSFMNNAFEEGQSTSIKILEKLQQQLKEFVSKGVKVEYNPKKDPLTLLILVPEGLLEFKLNSAEIPPGGDEFLASFIPKLTDTIYHPDFRNDISSVVVEGHTDSSGPDTHNLELSQQRSMSVVGKCLSILESSSKHSKGNCENKRDYFLRVLSASGRGEQDVILADGKEDHQQSRRVIFKIRVRSFEEKKLEKRLSNV